VLQILMSGAAQVSRTRRVNAQSHCKFSFAYDGDRWVRVTVDGFDLGWGKRPPCVNDDDSVGEMLR